MKKLFAVLSLAVVFAACGSGETKAPAGDSTKTDTSKAVADTTKKDSAKVAVDSTKKDSTKK